MRTERSLAYAILATPPPGEAVEVARGVLWMRLPLPFRLDHVNVYALEDGDGWALVDAGLRASSSVEAWTAALTGYGFFIDRLDIWAAVIATALVAALVAFSQYTKQGRAMRAVADDHQAALSVGISLRFIWIMVWSIAGFVALVAGIMWGTKSGVQFSLSLIALKALPVLMLGGFTSIPGAIVGGLIIGVGEKLFEYFVGPMIGGATETWFAYVLALGFLVFRPQGLFGERIIERV